MTVIAYYSGAVVEEMEKRLLYIDESIELGDIWGIAREQENKICGGGILIKIEICNEIQCCRDEHGFYINN